MSRYISAFEWEKRKARNNRILGFILGVVFTLGAFIMWRIL